MHLKHTTALATLCLLAVTGAGYADWNSLTPQWLASNAGPSVLPAAPPADSLPPATGSNAVLPAVVQPVQSVQPKPSGSSDPAQVQLAPMPGNAAAPAPAFVLPEAAPVAAAPPAVNPFEPPAPVAAPKRQGQVGAFELPSGTPASKAATTTTTPIDDRALRYYASNRDLVRVGAEIRRLKAQHPDWQPPGDMFAPVVTIDEQPLWDLYAAGKYGEMRRQIGLRQEQTPDWRPSADMSLKIDEGEARAKIETAVRYAHWNDVVETASSAPSLLVCGNISVLWALGEALARTGKLAQSFDLYRYTIENCGNEQERLATVQKAAQVLPAKGRDALISVAAGTSPDANRYERMRYDQLRGSLGEIAAGRSAGEIDQDDLKNFAAFIDADQSADDAGLMGWYFYSQKDWDAASAWFQAGMRMKSDPKLTEGYILSLRELERTDEAEEVAYKNREASPEITKIYIEIVSEQLTVDPEASNLDDLVGVEDTPVTQKITSSRLRRFAKAVLEAKSPLGAQAIGWNAMYGGNLTLAQDWFAKSIEWSPTEGGVIGAAVAAVRLKQPDRLRDIKASYAGDFPELDKFKSGGSGRSGKAWRQTRRSKR